MSRAFLLYPFESLCVCCYGAAPSLAGLMQDGSISIQPIPSGLFAERNAHPLNGEER